MDYPLRGQGFSVIACIALAKWSSYHGERVGRVPLYCWTMKTLFSKLKLPKYDKMRIFRVNGQPFRIFSSIRSVSYLNGMWWKINILCHNNIQTYNICCIIRILYLSGSYVYFNCILYIKVIDSVPEMISCLSIHLIFILYV